MRWPGLGNKKSKGSTTTERVEEQDSLRRASVEEEGSAKRAPAGADSSPQRVGVVSGVLSTTAEGAEPGEFADVVARRFGPVDSDRRDAEAPEAIQALSAGGREPVLDIAPLESDHPAQPELEVDPMAHVGHATTISGTIVCEEDLEIFGTVEGSVRSAEHEVRIGAEGHVKATIEARIVHVVGRVTGDVVASELVEVEAGGVVGGDVRAPRLIMHDGAVVVGALDMSASLPRETESDSDENEPSGPEQPARPEIKKVEHPTLTDDRERGAETF
jgi:cytoskeletal protein CcmA (bactofilin family)